mgnify:FL=1
MMVYPFSFSFFKSSPFVFSFCLLGGYKGGEAPITEECFLSSVSIYLLCIFYFLGVIGGLFSPIAVFRTDSPHLLPPWEEIKERVKITTILGIIFPADAPSPS